MEEGGGGRAQAHPRPCTGSTLQSHLPSPIDNVAVGLFLFKIVFICCVTIVGHRTCFGSWLSPALSPADHILVIKHAQ